MDEIKNEAEILNQESPSVQNPGLEPVPVVDIQFRTGSKVYFFDPGKLALAPGDHVIIETARGPEYGICASGVHTVAKMEIVPPLRSVIRRATAQDERMVAENREKEKRAFDICTQKIADHGLDMKLVSAEYAFDGSKILFFFTADDRVDFRELVKNLASIFRTRIELRQIGVRDKAKMVGGLGICGRPFCCKQFLDDFQPVSIKMAKTQNLSLNPTKISGTCGRLMCCLKYEQEAYEDLIRTSPKQDSFVDTPDGRGTVTDVNLLRQSVKVRMEERPEEVGCYKNCDICVLRNGKAKKNDPPIPADLKPISGGGKRPAPKEVPEEHMTLDPIRFRYRSDDIVPEPAVQPEEPRFGDEGERKNNNRRRRKRPQGGPRSEDEKPRQNQSRKDGPAPEGEGKKPQNRPGKPRREGGKPQNRPADAQRKPDGEQSAQPREGQAREGQRPNNRRRHNNRRPKPRNQTGGSQNGNQGGQN